MSAILNETQRLRERLATLWPKASLRAYVTAIMLIATLPVIAFMAYKIYLDVGTERERTWRDLERSAGAAAQSVEREVASSVDALSIIARTTLTSGSDTSEFERLLRQHGQLRPSWRGAFLIAANGDVLVDTTFPIAGALQAGPTDVTERAWFRNMLTRPQPMVSDLMTRSDDGVFTTAIAVPMTDSGKLRYVVGAWIDITAWQALLQSSGLPSNGFMSIYDRKRDVIARTLAAERFVGSRLQPDAVAAIADKPFGLERTTMLEGGLAYSAWHEVPNTRWGVLVSVPAAPLDLAVYQAVATGAAGALLCVMLGLYFASIVARLLVLPLDQLSRGTIDVTAPVVVREVADLRQALTTAQDRDVATRKRLQATADEFETLFNSSPVALAFAHDRECRQVTNNSAMATLFGLSPQQAVAPAVQVLRDGQPLAIAEQPLQRAAAHGEAVPPMELQVLVEGCGPRHVLAQAVPLRDATGAPRGAIGAMVDITERVRSDAQLISADQQLRESQNLIELAQEAGHVGFFHYRFDGDVLNWSPGQAKLFGIEPHSIAGTLSDWVRHINGEDRLRVEQVLRSMFALARQRESLEYRVTLPGGVSRWLSSRVLVIYDADGKAQQLIGVSVDVSDEKQAQRERASLIELERAARLQAEAANQAKDEFLAMLGHELRNPLSAIASAVEVLNRVEAGSELAANARAIAARQTRHLAHMMDDLLDVGRVISGKVLLNRRAIDLAMLAQRLMSTLEVTGEARRHVVELQLQPAWIDGDATRIEQVMSNLVTNALKYTPSGGRIAVHVRADDGQAVLEVSDNGPGIPPTLLPRVFDLFVQGERSLDRRTGGLGIGLTLARRLVELHGGTIDAKSSPRGSTFTVRLPAIEALPAGEVALGAFDLQRRSVVLVEDNEDALESLRTMLELDGHTVVTARDGVSGLRTVLELQPDVAVVDVGLPGMTGLEVAKRSRGAGFAGLMIAISGYGRASDVRQARESGFDAHLVKPVNASELQRLMTAQ